MKTRQDFLASLEAAGVRCIDSEIPHAAYLLDDTRRLAVMPPLRRLRKMRNGYTAILLTPKEARKLAEELMGILEVYFGMEG